MRGSCHLRLWEVCKEPHRRSAHYKGPLSPQDLKECPGVMAPGSSVAELTSFPIFLPPHEGSMGSSLDTVEDASTPSQPFWIDTGSGSHMDMDSLLHPELSYLWTFSWGSLLWCSLSQLGAPL